MPRLTKRQEILLRSVMKSNEAYNTILDLFSSVENNVEALSQTQTDSTPLAHFSLTIEGDQAIVGDGSQIEWTLGVPSSSSGISVNGNLLQVENSGLYEIIVGGGQSSVDSTNGMVTTGIQRPSGFFSLTFGTSTFSLTPDNGGGISCSAIIELNAGDEIRIFSSGDIDNVVTSKSVTVKQIT